MECNDFCGCGEVHPDYGGMEEAYDLMMDKKRSRNEGPPHEAYVPNLPKKEWTKIPTLTHKHPVLDVLDPWDTQVGGEHYKLPIQPLQYALANDLGIMEHAVVKYVTRHLSKGGKQDLEKAQDYLTKMIAHYYS